MPIKGKKVKLIFSRHSGIPAFTYHFSISYVKNQKHKYMSSIFKPFYSNFYIYRIFLFSKCGTARHPVSPVPPKKNQSATGIRGLSPEMLNAGMPIPSAFNAQPCKLVTLIKRKQILASIH
jgi:hypothetical protein